MTLVAGLDLETTGLDPAEHRIIEVYVGVWDLEAKSLIRDFSQRIDPQRSILADASRVHHIFASDLIGCPVWDATLAHRVRTLLDMADVIIGHNGEEFDIPFLNKEFERVGAPPLLHPCIDTMKQGRHATPTGKVPNLGELCFAYDVDYEPEKAHAADYDVHRMMECFFRGYEWGFFKAPDHTRELAHAA